MEKEAQEKVSDLLQEIAFNCRQVFVSQLGVRKIAKKTSVDLRREIQKSF